MENNTNNCCKQCEHVCKLNSGYEPYDCHCHTPATNNHVEEWEDFNELMEFLYYYHIKQNDFRSRTEAAIKGYIRTHFISKESSLLTKR